MYTRTDFYCAFLYKDDKRRSGRLFRSSIYVVNSFARHNGLYVPTNILFGTYLVLPCIYELRGKQIVLLFNHIALDREEEGKRILYLDYKPVFTLKETSFSSHN